MSAIYGGESLDRSVPHTDGELFMTKRIGSYWKYGWVAVADVPMFELCGYRIDHVPRETS